MQHAPKYQFSFSSSIQSQLIVQFERKINKMGNCLRPVQHLKTDEKTEAPLPPQLRLCLKQQWLQLLLTPEFSLIPSVLNKVNKYSHPSFIQIQKDIDRTYPFQSQFNIPQKKNDFKELLQMIALYYPHLGYIQGMNFIAGYLVIVGMTKIEAFNAFRSIMFHPQLMLIGIYEDDFPLVRVYSSVFWSLFEQQSAAFAKKVKELNLPDELWVFQWFICLFIYSFPRSYMNDILSFIWKEKQFACVRLALALIKLLQKTVQGKKNFQDEFIECIEMIKDQTYVRKNVPLQSLLREAHRINSKSVNSHLTKLTISNTFIRYFTASPLERTQLYKQLIAEKQREREEYYSLVSKGQSANCARNSSVTIIDDIEEIRAERYYSRIYNSLSLKVVNQSFLKFQRRYSAHQQQHNNAILTASLYEK